MSEMIKLSGKAVSFGGHPLGMTATIKIPREEVEKALKDNVGSGKVDLPEKLELQYSITVYDVAERLNRVIDYLKSKERE